MPQRKFTIALIKPSHYDDDGYVIQWRRSTIPSNSLASVYGLLAECAEDRVLGPEVDLETHVADVLGVIEHHELENIVLVGHSYGGMVVGGAADRVPQKIGSLVYLDAFIPEAGKSLWDFLPPEGAAAQKNSAKDGWRIARRQPRLL